MNESIAITAKRFLEHIASEHGMSSAIKGLRLHYDESTNTSDPTAIVVAEGLKPVFRYTLQGTEVCSDLRESINSNIGAVRLMGETSTESEGVALAFLFHVVQLKKMREALGF